MRERTPHRAIHSLPLKQRNANAAIVLAPVPLRDIDGLAVGFAALNDGDDTFLGVATDLVRNARERVVEDGQHLASRLSRHRSGVIPQHDAEAVKLLRTLVAFHFTLYAAVEAVEIGVRGDLERASPVIQRAARFVAGRGAAAARCNKTGSRLFCNSGSRSRRAFPGWLVSMSWAAWLTNRA